MPALRRLILALLVVLGLAGITTLWLHARSGAGIDFYQMWVGARVAPHARDFYSPGTAARVGAEYLLRAEREEHSVRRLAVARYRRQLELVSTPFLYTLYAPFRGSYERDLLLFQAGSLVALAVAIALLAHTFRSGALPGTALFAWITIVFEPASTDLRVSNVNSFVLLLLACALACTVRRRLVAAGALLAFATLAKPYLLPAFALTWGVWAFRRQWRDLGAHAAGAGAAALAAFIASSLYFRSWHIWLEWLAALRAMPQSMVPLHLGNFALAQVLRDLWGVRLSAVLTLASLALALFAGWRSRSVPQDRAVPAVVLGSVIGLLGSPLVWVHYLVLALPLLAWLLQPGESGGRRVRMRHLAAGLALLLLSVQPWDQFVPNTMQVAVLVNLGLLLAFAAGLHALGAEESPA